MKDAWRVEKGYLRALPDPRPDADRHLEVRVMKDTFVRVADVDYSVPPGFTGRRVAVRLSLTDVWVYIEGETIVHHHRSYVPADVVPDPAHARALRLQRNAARRLTAGDVVVPVADLTRYDALVGLS